MKSILMTTSAVLLVTGFAAGQAQAACPEDIDSFNRQYEQTLQNTAGGEALSTAEQEQLSGLRTAAENLHQAGNAEMCAAVIRRANLMLESAIAPQVIKPSELVGREVVNTQDENLGEIEDVMIDPVSGRIAYVVIEHGGFLGIGDDMFAVPWSAMQFVPGNEDTVLLDIPEEKLENAPRFTSEDETPLERREWVTAVHTYYGVDPYWQDSVGSMAMQYGAGAPATGTQQQSDQATGTAAGAQTQGGTGAAGETKTIIVPITTPDDQSQTETQPDQGEAQTDQTGSQATQSDQSKAQASQPDQSEAEPEQATSAGASSEAEPQTGTANLAAAQQGADGGGAGSEQVSMLMSRMEELEQQIQSLSEQVPGQEVTDAISRLEQQMQTLSEQSPGQDVTQSISRLEEQIQQLSQQVPGQDLQQQIARIEEQLAALSDTAGTSGQQTGGQQTGDQQTGGQQTGGQVEQPAAIVVVPDQNTGANQQQTGQQEQQNSQQQPAQPVQQQSRGTEQAGVAPQQEEQPQDGVGRVIVATPPIVGDETEGQPCEEMLAQLEEDLQRAEQLGIAIEDAESDFEEAQAMLNNNSEALCRAAIRRAHEELVAVGFEPTELN